MNDFELTTPVVFITYIRLDTAKQVFEQIRKAKPTKLYHISDAARDPSKQDKVDEVRKYINDHIDWPCQVFRNYAEENYGCRKRINTGLSWVFENEEQAIILEDDVVPSQSFFRFCQEMLEHYKDDPRIMMIAGNKRLPDYKCAEDYLFSKFCSIWGWATWRRAWSLNDQDMKLWPQAKKEKLLKKAYGDEAAMVITRNLEMIYEGELNTWDYPWQLSKTRYGGLEIVPAKNLVKNVGMLTEEATHTFDYEIEMTAEDLEFPISFRDEVVVEDEYDKLLSKSDFSMGFGEKVIRKIIPPKFLRTVRRKLLR